MGLRRKSDRLAGQNPCSFPKLVGRVLILAVKYARTFSQPVHGQPWKTLCRPQRAGSPTTQAPAPRGAFRSVCLHPSVISAYGARDGALRGVDILRYDAARDTLSTCADSGMVCVGKRESVGEALARATLSAQRGRSPHTACQPGLGGRDQGREFCLPESFRVAD